MVVTFYAPDNDDRVGKMRELAKAKETSLSSLMREAMDKYLQGGN